MEHFTPISAAIGGALIGLAAVLLMLLTGRIAGISGIFAACLPGGSGGRDWSAAFIAGLILAPLSAMLVGYTVPLPQMPDNWSAIIVAGALVGFGTRLGGGCTSGHGVCGMARLSPRSMVATAIFLGTAMIVVAITHHVLGYVAAALLCGFVFGWGLLISAMVQPAKVIGFLDIFGAWDPSLAVVIAAALAVSSVGFRLIMRSERPVLGAQRTWPTKREIDRPLAIGSVLFGIGWGLVGLCPGPALENIATGSPRIIVFVFAMVAGMGLHSAWQRWREAPMGRLPSDIGADG